MIVTYSVVVFKFWLNGVVPVPYSELTEAIEGCESMRIFNRVLFSLVYLMAAWPVFAADFYWSCTTSVGTRYADATQCDKGDTAVKVLKDGIAPAASAESGAKGVSTDHRSIAGSSLRGTGAPLAAVCPTDPAVCARPDYDVSEGTPRAQAITRFMRQKECEFLQRFPGRCTQSIQKMGPR